MSMSVFLTLKANGSDVEGSSQESNRDGTIECASFDYGVNSGSATGRPTADRDYEPIRIVKRQDKSTPLIWKALCDNAAIEAIFQFYRPNADGVTENYYTVEIKEARIATIDFSSPHSNFEGGSLASPTETVTFVFNNMKQTFNDGGIEHEDVWRDRT